MYVYTRKGGGAFQPVMQLLAEWRDMRDRNFTPGGTRRVDEAYREGEKFGYDRGIAAALAVLANEMRVQMFDKWDMVPILTDQDMRTNLLRPALKDLEETLEGVGGVGTNHEIKQRRDEALAQWLVRTKELHAKLAITDDMEKQELERHRKAVLAKEEPATDEDAEWLKEELDKAHAMWSEIGQLLPKQQD